MNNAGPIIIFVFAVLFCGCCKDDRFEPSEVLGEVTVDLDANKSKLRTRESPLGNMICDGLKSEMERRGEKVDFVLMNGGGIRFDPAKHPNGIYQKGIYTTATVDEMLPFGNKDAVVKVTGRELKSIFERSAAHLPGESGAFLQVSGEIKIYIDTSKAPQVLNDIVDPPIIASEGKRITSIKINGAEYDTAAIYTFLISDFLVEPAVNDGYVTLANLPEARKSNLGDELADVIKEYIRHNAPISPVIAGRIIIK